LDAIFIEAQVALKEARKPVPTSTARHRASRMVFAPNIRAQSTLESPWRERPQDLYEYAPCGYLTTLPDHSIVQVYATFLDWTGFSGEALIGGGSQISCREFQDLLQVTSRRVAAETGQRI
jgi:hypothetical protein